MPELPEVETVRRGLRRHVVGRRIGTVEVGRERAVRRTSREELVAGLQGARIVRADRRGKYLLLPLDTGDTLMIHLRMSGQVLLAAPGSARPPHTHVVVHVGAEGASPPAELWFVDPRTFGEMVVFDPARAETEVPELARLGPDPLLDTFGVAERRPALGDSRRAVKPLLLDQHVVAGIGNIYADEILHRARLRPDRAADTLARRHLGRLRDAIVGVLGAAVDAGGSTLGDAQYVDLKGRAGTYQTEHAVYGRTGERCRTCGRGWIRRSTAAGRSTHWCPVCQH